jgi:sugar lactone lactonase YvrE
MEETTRRTVLGSLGFAAAAGLAGGVAARGQRSRGNDQLERVLSTGRPVPENIGFAENGDLYVGITGGSVRRLPADRTDETGLPLSATSTVGTYPGGVAGVFVTDGVLYTAVNGEFGGVYAFDLGSEDEPRKLATLLPEGNGFVNDLYAEEDGDRLLVTESFGGVVYEVPFDGGDPEVWVDSPLLDTASFGANGITRIADDVYVNVTRAGEVGRIVRAPLDPDGSAGAPETYVESEALFGADGLTARGPQLYVAVNGQNRITRVTPSRRLQTVVERGALSFPSEVVFDPTAGGKAFVCNFSPSAPEQAGVLRTHP